MTPQLAPSRDLGLELVLENGLAVIRQDPIDESRRRQILDRLIEIFSEADRGSQALKARNLLFAAEERPAFERFTLFFRYLKDSYGDDLPRRLSEAVGALTELRDGNLRDNAKRASAGELIEGLLAALQREIALSPLAPPRTFHYG